MTDTTPEAVERLARVLDGPFYRVEGYAGPYIDEATLRDEHTAAAATLRAQQARIARLTAQGEDMAAREALACMMRYSRHDRLCAMIGGYGYCTCGLEAKLEAARAALAKQGGEGMTDTTREAVNLTGLDDYLRAPSVGLPWDIRIRIADALRLQQAEIAHLTVERDAALAQVAGAFEAAAEAAYQSWWDGDDAHELSDAIRALTPDDATAALDRIKRQAWAEGASAVPSTPVDNQISADPVGKEG